MASLNLSLEKYKVSSEGDFEQVFDQQGPKHKVFLLHNIPSLDKLYLSLSDNCGKFYIDIWVSVTIARNLQHHELIDTSICLINVPLPDNLLICKTLEFLISSNSTLIIHNESFLKFLDGCPILHSVSSKFVKRKYIYTFSIFPSIKTINASSLEYLNLGNYMIREFI
ncbi:hypothetical protein M9H77_23950 [Catharanthus roseus]|uniref:Uncharacterized protein n=1 Tax=Catharanthus roseus TaxID=4058 RepID=A0ACC0AVZ1_CATRO|nr:hypothetical protein M9H77_23950 [Catharanthus roseus]